MSYTDPNDPARRTSTDPLNRDPSVASSTVVDRREGGGMSWFIVGALIIAAGVLAFLYFGNDTNTASNTAPTTTEGAADTGRAATDTAPAESAPAPASPAMPADTAPANAPSAPATDGGAASPAPGGSNQ
jgi:hypothetical protein